MSKEEETKGAEIRMVNRCEQGGRRGKKNRKQSSDICSRKGVYSRNVIGMIKKIRKERIERVGPRQLSIYK